MRLTSFGFSPSILKAINEHIKDFQFNSTNFVYKCNIKAAILIAPIIKDLIKENPNINCLEITVQIPKPFLLLLFNTLSGNQLMISRKNANLYLPLAEFLHNDDLKKCIYMVSNKSVIPSEFISYVLNQDQKGLTILHDLRYISSNFNHFYRDPSINLLSHSQLKAVLDGVKVSNENRKHVKEYYKKLTNQTNTLENYFVFSSSVTRNTNIELSYEEDNELLGIIANLTALAGKNIYDNRIIFINTPVPVKNLHNIVDLKNQSSTIRILCNSTNYIQYDFRERQIALTSVTIQVGNNEMESPDHWAIFGSNNFQDWNVLIEINNDKRLKHQFAIQNYKCSESSYYRYIMFLQNHNFSNRKSNQNVINLSSIEFFGKLTVI